MDEPDWLAQRFEAHRPRLRGVAYRMLGSLSEADDAVQETWLRLSRSDPGGVENLAGWLTTVVARVCLNMLQSRQARREEPLDALGVHLPDPIVGPADGVDPEHEALVGDSIGLALLVVLEALAPAERVAFVLHDVFAVPFDEIAPIVGRTPAAARQLASRARRRVQGTAAVPDVDLTRQREVVDAFLAAARGGDFEALLAVLDPDVILRTDRGAVPAGAAVTTEAAGAAGIARAAGTPAVLRGARAVAASALTFAAVARSGQPALVNGVAGLVAWGRNGRPFAVIGFTVRRDKIVAIDILADPVRLGQLDLSVLDG